MKLDDRNLMKLDDRGGCSCEKIFRVPLGMRACVCVQKNKSKQALSAVGVERNM
jgi:hypothetical protein